MNSIAHRADNARPVPAVDLTATGRALPFVADDDRERDEQRITCLAAAVYIARCAYNEAITNPDPAETLDKMCDAMADIWPEVAARVLNFTGRNLEFAETMRAAVADRLWAFAAIEHSRTEAGDGYGYVFDLLADQLRAGADPTGIRTTALDVPRRLRELADAAGHEGRA